EQELTKKIVNRECYNATRHKVGAIMRTDHNLDRLPLLKDAINSLLRLPIISLIHILIYTDEDKGLFRNELIKEFGAERKRVTFDEVGVGCFYTDILNDAINEQTRQGIDYSLVLSPEAHLYITKENVEKLLNAAKQGSYFTTLALNEYKHLIEMGCPVTALTLYKNTAVNFTNVWKIGATVKGTDMEENSYGMSEIYVAKNLLNNFGNGSIVIVEPSGGHLIESDDAKSKQWREQVMATKEERFKKMCALLQIDINELKMNITYLK
ncbi:hypothetical protein KKD60_00605, partial [Patescibacteria group bacterium]|nr:hypothetical protein [Patescibacteria group bacterium]